MLRANDPDGTAWRRALRAAIVVPAVFALGIATGSDVVAFYALFGAMAHLVFGDYGGPPRHRAAAYLTTTLAGLVLIAAGTAVSQSYVAGAIATLFVGFTLTLAGVIGPAVAQLRTPLLLAFVLPATTSASLGHVGPRLEGWALAGVLSLAAAFVLVPRKNDLEIVTEAAAASCETFATVLEPTDLDALDAMRTLAAATSFGATTRRRALILLIDELRTFNRFLTGGPSPLLADRAAHAQLEASIQQALGQCADALRSRGDPPDLEALDVARAHHRVALERWAEAKLRGGAQALDVLDALDGERQLRLLSHVALGIATATTITAGAPLPVNWHDIAPRVPTDPAPAPARTAWRTVRTHLDLTSVRFHDALRAGVALGLAVWVAGVGDFAHGFWVALGALAVLRTSVLAGQKTAVQAIIGTTVGFAAALPLLWLVGSSKVVPWVLLPPLVFLSAYASGALPFAVGQAAFTTFVVLAVNILEPKGWHTGAIRVEDVLAGTAVALVAGIVFWPRGARVQVRKSLAALYCASATLLAQSLGLALHRLAATDDTIERAEADALGRAQAAVTDLVAERGHAGPHVPPALSLLSLASRLRAAAARIQVAVQLRREPPPTFAHDVDVVVNRFRDVAGAISDRRTLGDAPRIGPDRRATACALLAADATSSDEGRREDAFAIVWLGHWLLDLEQIADGLAQPVAELAR